MRAVSDIVHYNSGGKNKHGKPLDVNDIILDRESHVKYYPDHGKQ